MRAAPSFWWQARPNAVARLLQPAGNLYGAVTAWRMARPGAALPGPVLCVGNLVAGGAGKTPTALAVAARLSAAGHRPAFLSRGYGRVVGSQGAQAVIRVDPTRHAAVDVGDEPLLLAAAAPTYVSTDRRAAGRQALADGATVLVLDDGLQNPQLAKTAALAVADAATGVGNGLCVPAGPLRAPVDRQWPAVSALCLIGDGAPGDALARAAVAQGKPVLRAAIVPDEHVVASLAGRPLVAFAGLGRPEKFFTTLRTAGLRVVEAIAFPDHHRFSHGDRDHLQARAAAHGGQLITTGKDRVRLPADFPALALPIRLDFADPSSLDGLLATWLGAPKNLTRPPG